MAVKDGSTVDRWDPYPSIMETSPANDNAFQLLIAAIEEYAIFMLDPAGRIVSWNAGAERIKGYKSDEIMGRHFSIFYTDTDLKEDKPARVLMIAQREGQYQEEGWRLRKDGSRFWASVLTTAIRGQHGELLGFGKVTHDITEKMRVDQELRLANARLNASNRELEMFASVASHDLQEPLRKVQAFGEQLAAEYGDRLGEQGAFYISRMQSAATRMRTLIDDILAYSRVSTQVRPAVAVNLEEIVAEVLEDLETCIGSVNGRVEVSALPVVEADPVQMRQLFQNLIGNAMKFHRPGRPARAWVTVVPFPVERPVTGGGARLVELCVRDNGIGFQDEYGEKIFGVFQRLHGRGEFEGTGIGLAICRKIVERHGGHIEAHGRPDEGAEFCFTLPAAPVREGRDHGPG